MQTSVAALFVAGILPGLLLAVALFVTNSVLARLGDHPRLAPDDAPPLFGTSLRALPALSLPIIIVGGIVLGWMTPTESAAVAVFAACAASYVYGLVYVCHTAGLHTDYCSPCR